MTTTIPNFTQNELVIVNALVNMLRSEDKNPKYDPKAGGFSYFDAGVLDDGIWSTVLIEEAGPVKTFRGVFASLVKKDIFTPGIKDSYGEDGAWTELTENGREVIKALAA